MHVLVVFLASMVALQNTTTYHYMPMAMANAGITPDSPLYPLDLMWDSFREWVASLFGAKAEAMAKMDVLNERLAELYLMSVENKTAYVDKVLVLVDAKIDDIEHFCQMHPNCTPILNQSIANAQMVVEECLKVCPKEAKKRLEMALEHIKAKKGMLRREMRYGYKENGGYEGCQHSCHRYNNTHPCCNCSS